jgi:ankyrin repeat protein
MTRREVIYYKYIGPEIIPQSEHGYYNLTKQGLITCTLVVFKMVRGNSLYYGNIRASRLLLNTFPRDADPITIAVSHDHVHIVRLLIELGFRINIQKFALMDTISYNVLKIIVDYCTRQQLHQMFNTVFVGISLKSVRLLLEHGTDVNVYSDLFTDSIVQERVGLVKFLLRSGFDIRQQIHSYLSNAILSLNPNIIKAILDYGVEKSIILDVIGVIGIQKTNDVYQILKPYL